MKYIILYLKYYIESFFAEIILKQNRFSKMASFDSSILKNIVALSACSIFPVKLIYCIAITINCYQFIVLLLLFLSYYNFWNNYNLVPNQLWNHPCDQLHIFAYVLESFLTGWLKKFFHLSNIVILYFYSRRKIFFGVISNRIILKW